MKSDIKKIIIYIYATNVYFSLIRYFYVRCENSKDIKNQNQPNIILIVADDLGWMDVGFHGSDEVQTPNIDALAYHGLSIHRHYALPTCSPSRTALLTGRYPIRTDLHHPLSAGTAEGIPLNETLLPQYLKRLGYKTHLVGKWHVGSYSNEHLPTHRGFDSHFGYYSGYIGYFDGLHISTMNVAGLDVRRNEKPAWEELAGKYATNIFTDEAINIINKHNKNHPLFLELAQLPPHSGNIGGRLQVNDVKINNKEFGYIKDENRRLFAGMLKGLDDSVGNIVTALDRNNMLENSIIVFMSDNGAPSYEPLWDTTNYGSNWPLRGEKGSLHDGGVRTVAAIWSLRLLKPSSIYKNLFHMVDWLPTLFVAAGGDISQLNGVDGVNQWESLVNNQKLNEKNLDKGKRNLLLDITGNNEAVISDHWKLIRNNEKSLLSFANNYYGTNGTGEGIPEYNITNVMLSPTGKSLNSLMTVNKQNNFENKINYNKENRFLELRKENAIECRNTESVSLESCYNTYCLFNLENDPCETHNMIDNEKNKFYELRDLLNNYRKDIVKSEKKNFDEHAHPKYWNNYWSPWINDTTENNSGNKNCNKNFLIILLSIFLLLNLK
ncbi:arylsulfatase B-like [Lycorma delicatula]|uniref:arylsulfatase B-like n=1 Tax=Lycorma delicatula TaxID=130591 RepID=UPI003F51411A